VSFKVDQGEILGLIGPNGSGKSTIFNMLSGTFPPSAGSIKFAGTEIAGLPRRDLVELTMRQGFYCKLADGKAEWFDATADAA
jgi:branched-chain amino acid transport system ATP-binding protein